MRKITIYLLTHAEKIMMKYHFSMVLIKKNVVFNEGNFELM